VIFERVVCGVDGTPEGLEAARQAARLVSPGGQLIVVTVVETAVAAHGGWAGTALADQLHTDAANVVEEARVEIEPVREAEFRLLDGAILPAFKAELERTAATLVCVGFHGRGRGRGIVLGSLPTMLVHDAACAVLVARESKAQGTFPAAILAGVDGSPQASAAADAAAALAERFGAELTLVVAEGGKGVDLDAVREVDASAEVVSGKPVDVLLEASKQADLVVLGSRGLHGLRALGSVSERVAHEASCSVLVVR
jgi:nucleotide-binding universal stress UspA family protein